MIDWIRWVCLPSICVVIRADGYAYPGRGTGVLVGRGGRGKRPKEGNDERVDDLNGQENDQGLRANGGVEGVNGNVEGVNGGIKRAPDFLTIISQQLQNLLPDMLAQVGNQGNVGNQNCNVVNENVGNVIVNENRVGCSYKEFLSCNPKEYDGKGGAIVITQWIEKMEFMHDMSGCSIDQKVKYTAGSFVEFRPTHEMQKLESELWNHAMVGAGHTAYTDRFHELARLVPHLKAVQIFGTLIDEAVRNGSIKKVEKRGNLGEPSKDKNSKDDNKRTRSGNVFATTINPVGRENTGTWPKCTTCNSYHALRGTCRTCFNCNRPGHLPKDYKGVPRNVNPINARKPIIRACYECGSTDHVRSACPRLNRVQGPKENHPNQVAANNGGQGHENQRNQARDRAFMLGAEEACQDPNIVTGLEPNELGFTYEIEIGSGKLVEIDKVIKGYKLEIEGHVFDIDLIPFRHGSFDVIIGERPKEKAKLLMRAKASDKKQEEIVMVRDFSELVNISKRHAFWSLNEDSLKIIDSDYQYVVNLDNSTSNVLILLDSWTSGLLVYKEPLSKYSKEEVAETMAETMEQYMSKTRADYGSGVARPKIENKDNFEQKGQFLKELRTNTFSGSDHEDANEHIEKFLEIVDLLHILNITIDQVMLREFPIGAIPLMTVADAKIAIQEMAEYSQKCHNRTSKSRSTETSDGLAAIQAQLNNLGRKIKKVHEKVYAAQVGCEQYKGPHYIKDFPLKVVICILQYSVIHHPPKEMSEEIMQARDNLMKSIQTFLKKFNRISFRETPKFLSQAWDFFEIQHAQLEDIKELLHQLLKDLQIINEELAEYINSLSWNRPAFYDDDDEYSIQYKEYLENSSNAIALVLPTEEPDNSLSMGDEHLSTIRETKSDEVIKSSVETLSKSQVSSSDDESFSVEDVPKENFKIYSNPLFDNEIISSKIDPHHFSVETDLIESLLNQDILTISKIYFFLEEFSGELAHIDLVPSGINKADFDPEEEIRHIKELFYDNSSPRPLEESNSEISDATIMSLSPSPIPIGDSDSQIEEIDLFLATDDLMPPSIENDDYDSEGDIHFLEELLSNDPFSLPENEIAPDLEASLARCFVHRPLEFQSLAYGNPIS
uniref:CCHC-type domain-containing protein n=1 Tax=Tanacetum cinerariifolium TaxID=118510 RepID=A0A6L2NS78_TANCI|nr:hypothetical protein [Tanacetum cinerariifolium]